MKGKSPSDYVKTVYLSDLFYELWDKLYLLIAIGVLAFLLIFVPSFMKAKSVANEKPYYVHTVDARIQSNFDSNSLLSTIQVVFDTETLGEIAQYGNIDAEPDELRKCMTYTMEGKNVVRFNAYACDPDTAERVTTGIVNVALPKIGEEVNAEYYRYTFSKGMPREIKIEDQVNNDPPGILDITGKGAQEWEEYCKEKASYARMLKNSIVAGCGAVFGLSMILIGIRLLGRKAKSLMDVEAASGRTIAAVTDSNGGGVGNLCRRISDAMTDEKSLCLVPVSKLKKKSEIIDEIELNLKNLLEGKGVNVLKGPSLAESPEAVKLCKENNAKAVLLVEDENTKDYEITNAMELFANSNVDVLNIGIVNVKPKKIKRQGEWFGKYYI